MSRQVVLVVDDKENQRKLLTKILERDFEVMTAEDGLRALALVAACRVDVVVSDIKMPGKDGETLLREIKEDNPEVEVILMTAYASVSKAVEAMKEGAYYYLSKPFDPDEALLLVQRAADHRRLRQQARDLRDVLESAERFEKLVGKSAPMQKLFKLLQRAAQSDATVLVGGESGTGKELVAHAIHATSDRLERPFIPINCGALPDELIESELFGHKKGSFTGAVTDKEGLFEAASGGTVFLDEIGDLPLQVQVKLNRALQEKTIRRVGETGERSIDVRVISATNVDLRAAVSAKKFREDLYYRLNVFPVLVPPLRDRRGDIITLAAHFLGRVTRNEGPLKGFTPRALKALNSYDWPGNVRELENAVERAVAVAEGDRIDIDDLPEGIGVGHRARGAKLATLTYREAVDVARDETSREYLVELMSKYAGNVTQAAEQAGMQRESLHRLLKKYRLRSEDFKETVE